MGNPYACACPLREACACRLYHRHCGVAVLLRAVYPTQGVNHEHTRLSDGGSNAVNCLRNFRYSIFRCDEVQPSPNCINQLEVGKRSLLNMRGKLAHDALGITPDLLLLVFGAEID